MRCLSTVLLASAAGALLLADGTFAQVRQAERLRGGNENPPVISDGTGNFRAERNGDQIEFRLRYDLAPEDAESDVTQAHLHIANPGNNGEIVVFLCSNAGNEPEGVAARDCPPSPNVVEGEIVAADVLEIVVEDITIIEAGDLDGLFRLMSQGAVYANVHSGDHPTGEVRGQVRPRAR
jgi:hypothetical protein